AMPSIFDLLVNFAALMLQSRGAAEAANGNISANASHFFMISPKRLWSAAGRKARRLPQILHPRLFRAVGIVRIRL
ncbi:MAG: hypothetical protein ABIR52_07790, partial [Casimicrobiaceae bacterium]